MTKFKKYQKQGQLLLEVLFSMSVVTLVLVALVSATIVSVRNSRYSQNVVLANQYSREALETVRKERDQAEDWVAFVVKYSESECLDGTEGCLCALSCDYPAPSPNTGIFYRCLYFNNTPDPDPDKSQVTACVSWQESGRTHVSKLDTTLTKWSK